MELKNFHTHTTYCDGKNTAEEMILAAVNQGFTALGFSGHSHTSIDPSYCMTTADTRRYIDEIKALRKNMQTKSGYISDSRLISTPTKPTYRSSTTQSARFTM